MPPTPTTVGATLAGAGPTAGTRDRALTAAREAVLELGATRTTMVGIARRSGLGRTTLYRHWPDITALLADLLTRELTAVADRVDPTLRHTAPARLEDLADALCAVADAVRTDPLLDALRRETGLLSEYVFHRLGTSQRRLIEFLRDLLTRTALTDPRLAHRDPATTATMLFLAVQGVVLSAPLADPPLDPEAWRAELHRLVRGYLTP